MTLALNKLHPLDALAKSCRSYPGGVEALAVRMGKNEFSLRKELAQGVATHRVGYDEELSTILDYLKDAGVKDWAATLHAFAYRHGHLMVQIPDVDGHDSSEMVQMVCAMVKEVGDVGGSLTAAKNERGDGKRCISSREFKDFDVQVEEAMAALAALRERVREEHLEAKKGGLVK